MTTNKAKETKKFVISLKSGNKYFINQYPLENLDIKKGRIIITRYGILQVGMYYLFFNNNNNKIIYSFFFYFLFFLIDVGEKFIFLSVPIMNNTLFTKY
jgi:hypothetical protein